MQDRITQLRQQITAAQEQLSATEEKLAARKKEIEEMDARVEARLGHLFHQLANLEEEIDSLERRFQKIQGRSIYGENYDPVQVQYQDTWTASSQIRKDGSDESEISEHKNIKQLYRELARRYHPDLAESSIDRAYRNEKMAALNSAYASGSLAELFALETDQSIAANGIGQTEEQMARALERELVATRRNNKRLGIELDQLHHHPIVKLSLEIKLARRGGRNLLSEMSVNLQTKIDEKISLRDKLRLKLDHITY